MTAQEEALVAVSARKQVLGQEQGNVAEAVRAARQVGCSWSQIGRALGMSKEGAWGRYKNLVPSLPLEETPS